MDRAYFLTVNWCKKGHRGIFCDTEGHCFRKDDEPHSQFEMQKILGPFWLFLAPQSELFTIEQLPQFSQFIPLPEYSHQFGIAIKPPCDPNKPLKLTRARKEPE